MKKWTAFLFLVLFWLTACSGVKSEEVQEQEEYQGKEKVSEKVEEEESTGAKDHGETKEEEAEPVEPVEPQYELTANWSIQPISDANPQVALITIDDAPDTYAVEMAKTLKEKEAPAIFFVNGHFIETEEGKKRLKEIHDMGFAIGNHTASHASLQDISEEEQHEEMVGLNDKIEEIIGERPKFFRAPFGQNTDYSKQLAAEENMLVMNWTYGYDWESEYQDASALADMMVNTPLLNNGANLLMHDREWTNGALGEIIDGLREKGYDLLDPALIKTP
ncbi:Polysaccharide deacetylase [Halobacillus karajensis]|uniref:polysaccharide deacetylase family protein n=1 Tax=Halobacillus karajensis TaxID=195088 RepID=UPI0008A7548A|nr:polysaccharide deacetylase family protein [Halobacillus karajensis]SEH70320.1 Polysaccharide deacetylase [Halobacillus karajensis]